MFRFADVLSLALGDTRIAGGAVYMRAPTMEDWAEWAELRTRSRTFPPPGADLAGRFTRARSLPPAAAPAGARMAGGRGLRPVHLLNDRRRWSVASISATFAAVSAQAASVGYWMGPAPCRPGPETDAFARAAAFVFDELRLHRLEAACLPHNDPSKAVLAKVASTRRGWRAQYLRINGQWADHLLFRVLRADYDQMLRASR